MKHGVNPSKIKKNMKQETSKHTPGKWGLTADENWIFAVDVPKNGGDIICLAPDMPSSLDNWKANAEFIVRACNAHEEMLEEIKELKNEKSVMILALRELNAKIDDYWNATPSNRVQYEKGICIMQKKCHSLISKAEGK